MIKLLNKLQTVKSPWVIILIGGPASGKSTLSRKLENCTIICRDDIIMELNGTDDYHLAHKTVNHKEVDAAMYKKLLLSSKNKENVVIDMLNMKAKRRRCNLANFGKVYTKIAVVMPFLTKEEFDKRNAKRKLEENKFFSDDLYEFISESYQKVDKAEEGFNHVIYL